MSTWFQQVPWPSLHPQVGWKQGSSLCGVCAHLAKTAVKPKDPGAKPGAVRSRFTSLGPSLPACKVRVWLSQ